MDESQSEDSFVRFGAKPTQRACLRDFLRDREKTRESKVPGQSTEESSQQKLGEGAGQRKVTAKRGVGTCGLRGRVGQREKMSQRSWWLCGNFTTDYRYIKTPLNSVKNFSLLALGAKPSLCLFVLLFFHSLGCVCCVLCCLYSNVKCPWLKMRETTRRSDCHELV